MARPGLAARLGDTTRASTEADAPLLASDADPIHPRRVYGELLKGSSPTTGWSSATAATSSRSRAGWWSRRGPGGWLDPGPYGCLGTGLGYAIAARLARPSAQIALMLGDGAAGCS